MVKAVMVLVIGVILLIFAFRIKASLKKDKSQRNNYTQTIAAVERVVFADDGPDVWYYVTFTENGSRITAQTDCYSSKTKSLSPGDEVKIGYYFARNGAPRAVIYDDRVQPVSESVPFWYRFFAVIGLLLILVAVVMFVKNIFL